MMKNIFLTIAILFAAVAGNSLLAQPGNKKGKAHKAASAQKGKDMKEHKAKDHDYRSAGEQRVNRNDEKVAVCHKGKTIYISRAALKAHIGHGDYEGACGTTQKRVETAPAPAPRKPSSERAPDRERPGTDEPTRVPEREGPGTTIPEREQPTTAPEAEQPEDAERAGTKDRGKVTERKGTKMEGKTTERKGTKMDGENPESSTSRDGVSQPESREVRKTEAENTLDEYFANWRNILNIK